ncbi:hypothetical protein FRC09_005731 [Ceratobasidium sp. 395]|nr:hypothetical protein FRC09_005731 [Ceratobasidium sp. 395]
MEISDRQLKQLLPVPWLSLADNEGKKTYLLKFFASPEDVSCYVLITDTRHVWAEVLQGRHISRRADQLDPPAPNSLTFNRTEKQERRFRRQLLDQINSAHSLNKLDELEVEVQADGGHLHADLCMKIITPNLTWQWNGFALHPSHAADVIYEHFTTPMITLMAVALATPKPAGDMAPEDIQKVSPPRPPHPAEVINTIMTASGQNKQNGSSSTTLAVPGVVQKTGCGVWDTEDIADFGFDPIVQDLSDLPEPSTLDFGADSSSEIEEDEYLEPEHEPEVIERDYAYIPQNSSPPLVRSSPAPMQDGSGTEDDDDEEESGTQAQTQLESQAGQSQYLSRMESQHPLRKESQHPLRKESQHPLRNESQYQSQSQRLPQHRPPIQATRSQPQPARRGPSTTSAQQNLRSLSQPQSKAGTSMLRGAQSQVAGLKRGIPSCSDSDSDEELQRRIKAGATAGAIGKKMRPAKKF